MNEGSSAAPAKSKLARPFLKWAGGKGQLLEQIESYLPGELESGRLRRYAEPFIGSGAVFFKVMQSFPIEECLIADINAELILVYRTVQKDVEGLIARLGKIESQYLGLREGERADYYYRMRSQFNDRRKGFQYLDFEPEWVHRAAMMLFLNRTGYNGLFRLNSKGEFNVPMGRYKKPRILDADNLRLAANLLQKVRIEYCDFEAVGDFIDRRTVVYFDPPYRPLSKTAHFTAYSKEVFDDQEQLRLADFYRSMDAKGGKLLLSNSDPHNSDPEDDFFEKAYAGYRIERIQAKRNINSDPEKRGPVSELLILNYRS
jgi:DNA adenine methylase